MPFTALQNCRLLLHPPHHLTDEIERKTDHPLLGIFKLRFDGPDAYTLVLDNSGVIRSPARILEIEGSYQPD